MRSLSQALSSSSRAALAAALLLAPLPAAQDAPSPPVSEATRAPGAVELPEASGAAPQKAEESVPRPIPGEILPPESHGPSFIESMAQVMERQRALPEEPFFIHKERNGAHGTWVVPSRSGTFSPHSGEHYATNKWGDTSMGIGFPGEVTLEGAWIAAQGLEGAWSTGVRVIGFRDGAQVGRTDWFETIDREPRWFAIGLRGIDRAVFESRAVVDGAGFYGLDDLTFELEKPGEDVRVVLDFDDLPWRASLTGSGYGGLTWETGTGDFEQEVREVHEPKTPPGTKDEVDTTGTEEGAFLGGLGTAPELISEFVGPKLGDNGAGWLPPDTCGAVGPDHFISVVNQHMSVYEKDTGNRLVDTSLQNFFNTGGSAGDPRVVFDEHSGRWFVHAGDFSSGVFLAVSLTSDANGSWFKTFVNFAQGSDAGNWPDYPTLGVDENGVYIGAYMVGGNFLMSLFAIDKAPLVASTPSLGTVSAWRQLPWEGALQPCVTHGSAPGAYVVSRKSGGTALRLRRIDGPLTAPTLVELGNVSVATFQQPPSAPALGSTVNLSTVDNRLMNAVYRDGSIWTAHTINRGGRAGCRWYEIDAATATLIQSGNVRDPEISYFFPAVAVNADGDVLMGMSASSPNMWAGAYYTGRKASDPAGEMADPVPYKPGQGPYNHATSGTNRWGDYSLTCVDPVDDLTLWTIQEYSRVNNNWGTFIASFRFPDGDGTLGERYCPAETNSLGLVGRMSLTGSVVVADDDLTLTASDLPPEPNIGYFIMGTGMNTFIPPGSDGPICVAPGILRYLPPVSNTTENDGGFTRVVGTSGPISSNIVAGSTWNFQAWHRDQLFASSNLTDAVSVVFQ